MIRHINKCVRCSLLTNDEDAKKIALETYRILDTISKIKEFMFTDLDKTLELVNTPKGAPNFMLALVLCCYTEFWGKMKLPKGTSSERFNEFFKALGKRYENLMQQLGDSEIDTQKKHYGKDKIYHDIRCGLAHSYLVDGNVRIVIEGFSTQVLNMTIEIRFILSMSDVTLRTLRLQ
jgi:hypothetical protein